MLSASEDIGRYFIYLTNWGITLCMITTVLGAILVAVWYYHPEYSGKSLVFLYFFLSSCIVKRNISEAPSIVVSKLPTASASLLLVGGNINGACNIQKF